VGQTSRSLRQRYKQHTCYIKNNNPLSAYALHILNNQHEYGPLEKTTSLLKPINNNSLLTPYEQFFIQSFHKSGRLISEQNPGEPNPLLQLAINPSHPPTWPIQSSSNLRSAHTLNVAPQYRNLPHPTLPGMYVILIYNPNPYTNPSFNNNNPPR